MTTMMTESVSRAVAAEMRAALGRLGLPASTLAERLGKNGRWVSVRISPTASVHMTIDEITEMADALGVEAEGVIVSALRACRDSNPKPSDLEFWSIVASVNDELALDRRNPSAWGLAS